MSNKQVKKIRQYVRRKEALLVSQSWNCFFDTVRKLKFKYRLKLAWYVITKKDMRGLTSKAAKKAEKSAANKTAKAVKA